jgi:hypothetical protein
MNKYIELVKKWLADPKSVSLDELKANREAVEAASESAVYRSAYGAAYTAYEAAKAASEAAESADAVYGAAYWRNRAIRHIKEYEELTK